MIFIDLNCDLGEGGKDDAQIMPLISSCNIACGGHFGNEITIAKSVRLAIENGVNIGAHPSYPDLKNFGRAAFEIALPELKNSLKQQIERVYEEAEKQKTKLHHVKPHGFLYNELMDNAEKAKVLIEVLLEIDPKLILFVPPKSKVGELATGKLKTYTEGFGDRNYQEDFRLVSRQKRDAVLTKKEAIFKRVLSMVKKGKIQLRNDRFLKSNFNTICLHSDTSNCVEILKYLNQKLPEKDIRISGK